MIRALIQRACATDKMGTKFCLRLRLRLLKIASQYARVLVAFSDIRAANIRTNTLFEALEATVDDNEHSRMAHPRLVLACSRATARIMAYVGIETDTMPESLRWFCIRLKIFIRKQV